MKPFEARW